MWSFFLQRLNDDVQSRCGRWRLFLFASLCSLLSALLLVAAPRQIRYAGCCNIVIPLQFRNQSDDVHFTRRRRRRRRRSSFFSFVGRFESWRVGLLWLAGWEWEWEWEWRVVGTTPRACKLAVEIGRADYFVHTTSLLRWYVFRLVACVFLNLFAAASVCLSFHFLRLILCLCSLHLRFCV